MQSFKPFITLRTLNILVIIQIYSKYATERYAYTDMTEASDNWGGGGGGGREG